MLLSMVRKRDRSHDTREELALMFDGCRHIQCRQGKVGEWSSIGGEIVRTTYAVVCRDWAIAMLVRAYKSAVFTHARFLGGIGARRA